MKKLFFLICLLLITINGYSFFGIGIKIPAQKVKIIDSITKKPIANAIAKIGYSYTEFNLNPGGSYPHLERYSKVVSDSNGIIIFPAYFFKEGLIFGPTLNSTGMLVIHPFYFIKGVSSHYYYKLKEPGQFKKEKYFTDIVVIELKPMETILKEKDGRKAAWQLGNIMNNGKNYFKFNKTTNKIERKIILKKYKSYIKILIKNHNYNNKNKYGENDWNYYLNTTLEEIKSQ